MYNAAFYQGLLFILKQLRSSEKEIQINLEIISSIYNGPSEDSCFKPEGRIYL